MIYSKLTLRVVGVCHIDTGSGGIAGTTCKGSITSGAGGRYPRALWGRNVLYSPSLLLDQFCF